VDGDFIKGEGVVTDRPVRWWKASACFISVS
jgi:hypothetical protein